MIQEFSDFQIVDGSLHINRGNGLVPQICPYRGVSCVQWCPFFGVAEVKPGNGKVFDIKELVICKAKILCVFKED